MPLITVPRYVNRPRYDNMEEDKYSRVVGELVDSTSELVLAEEATLSHIFWCIRMSDFFWPKAVIPMY